MVSLENWTPQNFTVANFGHPVSKFWLGEYRRLCPICDIAPIENAPLLLFTVLYFFFFSSSFLFFSFLFLFHLVIYVHSRVSCSVVSEGLSNWCCIGDMKVVYYTINFICNIQHILKIHKCNAGTKDSKSTL